MVIPPVLKTGVRKGLWVRVPPPPHMKYLGIDYGAKRVGLAVSDEEGKIAFPRAVIAKDEKTLTYIVRMLKEENIAAIVMGDTRASGGHENPITKEAERFAKILGEKSGIPVKLVSELGTSVEASRYAPEEKGHDDSAAAAILLQRFLDMHEGDTIQK